MRILMSPGRASSVLCWDSVAIREAGEDQAPRTKISALIHNGFFGAYVCWKLIPELGQLSRLKPFRRGEPS
jgi:hypothetical protein